MKFIKIKSVKMPATNDILIFNLASKIIARPKGNPIIFLHLSFLVLIHIRTKGEVGAVKPVKALQINILIDRYKVVLILWMIHVISVLCLLCFRARLLIDALWSPAGKGLTSWLSFWMSNCEFVTFQLESWVRRAT